MDKAQVEAAGFGNSDQLRAWSVNVPSAKPGSTTQGASTTCTPRRRGTKPVQGGRPVERDSLASNVSRPVLLRRVLPCTIASGVLPPPASRFPGATFTAKAETLGDAIAFIDSHSDWDSAQKLLRKTCVTGIGRAVAQVRARRSNHPFNPKQVDLASIAFDVSAINQDLEGQSYRQAGFNTAKSFTNCKWGYRRVCREMGKITSKHRAELPSDSPYAELVAASPPFRRSAMKRFASELHQMGIPPELVRDDMVVAHGDGLRANMVGVKVTTTLRWIVRVWNKVAHDATGWPHLHLPGRKRPPASPPLSAYSPTVQGEIAAVRHWMEGGVVPGMTGCGAAVIFGHGRRPARRPATIKCRLEYVRLLLGLYVGFGHDPQTIPGISCLLAPPTFLSLMKVLWERGQERQRLVLDADRDHDEMGLTHQMEMAAQTLMMLANNCFPQPPEVLQELRGMARQARRTTPGEMTRKNQERLRQLEDPIKLGLLLNLAADLMREAMELHDKQPAEAARRARAAIIFAIECRIPLRIRNLSSCRIGHNLRFSGSASEVATLSFQAYEMKNKLAVEYAIGPRLLKMLQDYITHFLPFFAEGSPDFDESRWLFPADGKRLGHLSISRVREIICSTMAERVGVVFHPHLFRAFAVRMSLEHDPGSLEHARQVLGDKSMDIVTRHYAMVRRKAAALHQDGIIEAEAARLAGLVVLPRRRRNRGGQS